MTFSNAEPWRVSKKRWWKPGRLTKKGKLPKRFSDRDRLIQAGKPMSVMVDRCARTADGMIEYIIRTGQYRIWKERMYKRRIGLARRGVPLAVFVEKTSLTSQKNTFSWLKNNDFHSKWKQSRKYYLKNRKRPEGSTRPRVRNELADSLVERIDLSLREIAKRCGWKDRRNAWEYYNKSGQLGIRRICIYRHLLSIGKQPFSSKLRQEFSNIVEIAQTLAYNDAENKTYEFFISYPHSNNFTYESVLGVVTRYINAKTKGEKLSVAELSGGVISKRRVASILRFFNWKLLYKKPERLTAEQKETLQRVFPLPVSAKDIAYFIGSTYQAVNKNFRRQGKGPFNKKWVNYLGPIRTNMLASKIYGALDVGLNSEEAAEYYGTTLNKVDYARKHRQTIEPKLIDMLKKIHPDKKINKPYLEELL